MVRGSKWTSKLYTLVWILMGNLWFLESLEPLGGKSKDFVRKLRF